MNERNVLVVLAVAIGLAGCFTSKAPLIGDGMAAAPYARITYVEEGSDETHILVREGKGYVERANDTARMLFAPVGENLYVVQVTGNADADDVKQLYGFVAVDLAAGIARSYKTVAKPGDAGPGLTECDKDLICIDDLDAYVALATKAYQEGAEPDAVYNITVE
jgi:hypothetical protein